MAPDGGWVSLPGGLGVMSRVDGCCFGGPDLKKVFWALWATSDRGCPLWQLELARRWGRQTDSVWLCGGRNPEPGESAGGGGRRGSRDPWPWCRPREDQAQTGPPGQESVHKERTEVYVVCLDAHGKGSPLTLLGVEDNQVSSGNTWGREAGVKMKVAQLCPTLCDPVDYTVHGILQARILEWVAFPFCSGSSNPGIEPGSPALQADSLPTELSERH